MKRFQAPSVSSVFAIQNPSSVTSWTGRSANEATSEASPIANVPAGMATNSTPPTTHEVPAAGAAGQLLATDGVTIARPTRAIAPTRATAPMATNHRFRDLFTPGAT